MNEMTLDERLTEKIEWMADGYDKVMIIDAQAEIARLRGQVAALTAVLDIYADRANWTQEAHTSVLTGEVRADGWELEEDVTVLMDDYFVWSYDGSAGYEIAKAAIDALETTE